MASVATTDVTVAAIDEMDGIHGGIARRARAQLGVTAWGMQVLTLPVSWQDYPNHNHDETAFDPNQEEVYIPLAGSATLFADDETFELRPGTMARVAPAQHRRIVPGADGIQYVAIGGVVGVHRASPWTELGGPWPTPPAA
jgi:mannose-6-phosphate isomerase-like protein (cupin superfamily)